MNDVLGRIDVLPRERGFSLLEVLFVVALIGIISTIAIPMSGNALSFYRLSGDARSLSNAAAVAKMRAAATFSKARVYVDLTINAFWIETWQKTGTPGWVARSGSTRLSIQNAFSWGAVGTAPPNTQATIGQAAACLDDDGNAIANTACIVFNSRGIPVDSAGAPVVDAVYVTDHTSVYGLTVSMTGLSRLWRTKNAYVPAWSAQ